MTEYCLLNVVINQLVQVQLPTMFTSCAEHCFLNVFRYKRQYMQHCNVVNNTYHFLYGYA